MQQLVDQNVPIRDAAWIVSATYPETLGDTFYRWADPDDPTRIAVGVYGLWNSLRGDQSPLDGAKVSDDARTIAQFGRLNGWQIPKIVYLSGRHDEAISAVVNRTAQAMRAGDYFEPQEIVDDDHDEDRIRDLRRAVAQMDGAADYITSIPLPRFGA